MANEKTESDEARLLRTDIDERKKEETERKSRQDRLDQLKNRVSIGAIILTTPLSFIGSVRSERADEAGGAKGASESARRQATELWSYHQVKISERVTLEVARDRIRQDLLHRGVLQDQAAAKLEGLKLATYEERVRDFDEEAQRVFFRVQDLEKAEDVTVRQAVEPALSVTRYELGMKLITLALILLSVTILSGREWLFWAGATLGSIGLLVAYDGYFLFF